MSNINLNQLVGGKSCFILYIIFCNKFQVFFFALANIKANAFALINTKYACKLFKYLATPFKKLPCPI